MQLTPNSLLVREYLVVAVLALLIIAMLGCGGGTSSASQPTPDFTIVATPESVTLKPGSTSGPITVRLNAQNGFASDVSVSVQGIPQGTTVMPSGPFNVNPQANQDVTFSVPPSIATGTTSITFQGSSGSLTHTAQIQLNVAIAPSRTTFSQVDTAITPVADGSLLPRQLVYDAKNQHIFAADPAVNRVHVLSALDGTRVASIVVPTPSSMDLSVDGSLVWVATAYQQLIAIDTTSLEVIARAPVTSASQAGVFNQPRDLALLNNGKAVISMGQIGITGGILVLWDPSANAFVQLAPPNQPAFDPGILARTPDGSQVLVGSEDTSGQVFLYDATSNSFTAQATYFGAVPEKLAVRADGRQFAVYFSGQSTLRIFDGNLGLVNSIPVPNGVVGLVYSADSRFLYVREGPTQASVPGLVNVLDASTFQLVGEVSDIADSAPQAADNTGMVFGATTRGVTLLDASHPAALPTNVPALALPTAAAPNVGSTTGWTGLTLSGRSFESTAEVSVGSQLASGVTVTSSTAIAATVPPGGPGPTDITAYFSSGAVALAPDSFSYGPSVVALRETSGSVQGGDPVEIFGYGFGSSAANLTVTLGGKQATVTELLSTTDTLFALQNENLLYRSIPYPIQRLTITTPPGSLGPADLVVGATTVPGAFRYLQSVNVFPRAGEFRFVTYDAQRQRVYLTNTQQVEVFDLGTSTFLTPLTPPGGVVANSDLRQVVLTPDRTQLVVADFGAQAVYFLNPDKPGSGTTVAIPLSLLTMPGNGPARLAVTSTGKVFVAQTWGGSGATNLLVIDIATHQVSVVMQGGRPIQVSNWTFLSASRTGDVVCAAEGNTSDGPILHWDASSQTFTSAKVNDFFNDGSVTSDGSVCVAGGGGSGSANLFPTFFDAQLTLLERIFYSDYDFIQFGLFPGMTLHPSGGLLYQPSQAISARQGVDIFGVRDAKLRERILLADGYPTRFVGSGMDAGYLAIDDTGERLFIISKSGLTVAKLAAVPLSIGEVVPGAGPATGGTIVTVRGSGFTPNSMVMFGNASIAPTFVDSANMKFTTPSVPKGAVRVSVINPDGTSFALDNAFTAQ
jgi:hypothetical protein